MQDSDRPYNLSAVLLDEAIARWGRERPAIYFGDSTITYEALLKLTCRMGNFFRRLGVKMENRVLLALPDSPLLAAGFLGAARIGAVAVPVNPWNPPLELRHLLTDSRAVLALVTRGSRSAVSHSAVDDPTDCQILECSEETVETHRELLERLPETLPPADTRYDDPAFWLYSSGTTGRPKGVIHLQHDLPVAAEAVARQTLALRGSDTVYSTSKLFFAYGLGNSLAFPLSTGAAVVLSPEKSSPEKVLQILKEHSPTVFCSVPSLYALLLQALESTAEDLRSVRLFVSAGEILPPEIFHRWKERFGREILDGIGTTEMTHTFILNPPGRAMAGSSGLAVPGFDIRIVDAEGRPVAVGEEGDLQVRGECAAWGYWRNHEKNKQTFRGEWVATGDRYRVDEGGYYWFVGRSDDLFKVSGQWVSPVEIEAVLLESAQVLEAAVISEQDPEGFTRPKAFLVLKEGVTRDAATEESVRELIRKRLPRYKHPHAYAFLEEIPKTSTGKKQRYKLRSMSSHPDEDRA